MNEEAAATKTAEEPSMEDILGSIRRILSEEDGGEEATPENATELDPEPKAPEEEMGMVAEIEDISAAEEPEEEMSMAAEMEDMGATGEPEEEVDTVAAIEESPTAELETVIALEPGLISESAQQAAPAPTPTRAAPMPSPLEEMLELTPDMVANEIMSQPTHQASTDVLSELAAAILDRRDLAVNASSSEMTLEGIVREMLKPILREWLDRNLPYLIERLVKREIDLMVNRAERLED
jgi:cell pole-organizing protein PopZ